MTTSKRRLLKRVAMRGVVATLPIAIASAYASGIFLAPPRSATLDYTQVAEITNSPSTVGVADSSLFGMSQADINKTLDQLQALGVNNVRVLVPWANIETSDNVYSWNQMDMVMSAAAARNMGVMADINSTPLWAAPPNTYPGAGTPPVAQFSSFVQQFATKYGSTVSAYEIWNEPNYALFYQPIDPVSYTALLAAAYPVIKAVDPTATVVAGALGAGSTTGLTMNPVDFVAAMMKAGAGSYFDALSFHPYQDSLKFSDGYAYPGLGTPLEQLDAIKGFIGTAKSVWISEYGLPTSSVSQQQQSDYIKDLLDYWQGYSQAGPVFLYTTRDGTAGGSSLAENSYGLFNNNWTPKTAALMLQAWIKQHPQTPGTPTTPTPPTPPTVDPVAAYFQALAAQYAAVVAAYVAALQSWLGMAATPAAATPAVKVATVQRAAVTSLAVPADTAAGDVPATTATDTPAITDPTVATAVDAAKVAATAATAAADVVKETAATAAVDTATPVAATPAAATTPATTDPVVTKPVAAETPATAPAVTNPAGTKPADTTSAATTPAASGSDKGTTAGPTKSDTDKSGKSDSSDKSGTDKSDKPAADKPAKSDKSDKSDTDKSDTDKSGSTPRGKFKVRHAKGDKSSADASTASSGGPAAAK